MVVEIVMLRAQTGVKRIHTGIEAVCGWRNSRRLRNVIHLEVGTVVGVAGRNVTKAKSLISYNCTRCDGSLTGGGGNW